MNITLSNVNRPSLPLVAAAQNAQPAQSAPAQRPTLSSFGKDQPNFHLQRNLFAGAVGIGATALSFTVASHSAQLGASLGGVKGALAGAAIGGLATAVVYGTALATVSDPIFDATGFVAGGAMAGAAIGFYKGGLQGAALGAGLGAGAGFVARLAGTH